MCVCVCVCVCFLHVRLTVFYYDKQAALSTVCAHAARLQSLDFLGLLLVINIIRIVKGLPLFVYIHNKNKSL